MFIPHQPEPMSAVRYFRLSARAKRYGPAPPRTSDVAPAAVRNRRRFMVVILMATKKHKKARKEYPIKHVFLFVPLCAFSWPFPSLLAHVHARQVAVGAAAVDAAVGQDRHRPALAVEHLGPGRRPELLRRR